MNINQEIFDNGIVNYVPISKNDFYNSRNERITHDLSDVDILLRTTHTDNQSVHNETILLVFGGFVDTFDSIYNIIEFYSGPFIYFRDKENMWYTNKKELYRRFINKYAPYENYFFMGFSMGGYASLYLSVLFPTHKCICVAIAPQATNYYNMNNKILIQPDLIYGTTEPGPYLANTTHISTNLNTLFIEHLTSLTKRYILVGKSECDDYPANYGLHLNLDLLHLGTIINFPNVSAVFYNYASHLLTGQLDLPHIYNLVLNNFNDLHDNLEFGLIKIGSTLLRKKLTGTLINNALNYGIIDMEPYHISPKVQDLIANYGNINKEFIIPEALIIFQKATLEFSTNVLQTQSNIWCALIWKSLSLVGYNIPPQAYENITENVKNFDVLCYALNGINSESPVKNWCNFAIYILLYDCTNWSNIDTSDFSNIDFKRIIDKYTVISKYHNFDSYKK